MEQAAAVTCPFLFIFYLMLILPSSVVKAYIERNVEGGRNKSNN